MGGQQNNLFLLDAYRAPGYSGGTTKEYVMAEVAKKNGPGRPAVNPDESKTDKFARLAVQRTSDAVASIRKLKALHNGNYDEPAGASKKIISALRAEVDALEATFNGPKIRAVKETLFKL
jgi:hypothetical protein